MAPVWRWIQDTAYNFFSILGHTWFLLAFLLLGWFAMNEVDQAVDAVSHILLDGDTVQAVSMYAGFTVFALSVWYAARIMLQLARIRYRDLHSLVFLVRWLPRLLGTAAYLGPLLLMDTLSRQHDDLGQAAVMHIRYTLACMTAFLAFVVMRRRKASLFRFRPREKRLQDLAPHVRTTLKAVFMVIALLVVLFCLRGPGSWVATRIGAVNVIVLAMAVYSLLGMALLFRQNRTRMPLVLLLLAMTVLFSFFNDNHAIRTLPAGGPDDRLTVAAAFSQWIGSRAATVVDEPVVPVPVFVVAAEGGGIRSAYFTATMLAKLDSAHPGFIDHVFAVSTVSGGSVGAAMLNGLKAVRGRDAAVIGATDSLFSDDFLAPLNAAFMFPDVLQKFLPVAVPAFDRARWLEDAFSRSFLRVTGSTVLDSGLQHLREKAPHLPYLFVNATEVESGRKAIYSRLLPDSKYFRDDVDLAGWIGVPVPVKTIVSMSARFPFITPAATACQGDTGMLVHFVDGGYADNSGLGTAVAIAGLLNEMKEADTAHALPPYRVHVVLLKNSKYGSDPRTLRGVYETRAVISAFYNAWDNNVNRVIANARNYFHFNREGGTFIVFGLNRDIGILPLGWDLSTGAMRRISDGAADLVRSDTAIRQLLR